MSAAAATSQPGNKRPRSSEGQDNSTHAGCRGGAGSGPSAASSPPSRPTCVTDSFREVAVKACAKAVYKLTGAAKKAYGFKQSVATLEAALAEGTVPKTLKVQVPKAYEAHVGAPSSEVARRVSDLEKQMLSESLEAKKAKQVLAERDLSAPMAVFEQMYKELVHASHLPAELLDEAKAVMADQAKVFQFEWVQAQAKLAEKAEQATANRTAAAEAEARAGMEIEALPSRELIEDLVDKRVAKAVKSELARASANATASAGAGNEGKAKGNLKANPNPAQGRTSGSKKGGKKPNKQPKGPKNAHRK